MYWNKQASIFRKHVPADYREVLHLASLVLTNPIGWWTRRALRKAICMLITQNAQVCFVQITTNNAAHDNHVWHGLLHDIKIMQCFRANLKPEQYSVLEARSDS